MEINKRAKKDFSRAKVYVIRGPERNGPVYVGSTCKEYLSQRFAQHKANFKRFNNGKTNRITSYDLFDLYGVDACSISLLESFPECRSYDELAAREGFHQRATIHCVNRCIAGRTKQQYQQQYHLDHRDELNERSRAWDKAHEEHLKSKHFCECGGKYTYKNKQRHSETHRHQRHITTQALPVHEQPTLVPQPPPSPTC